MIKVAIMGCGVVGSGVMRMLTENQDRISAAAGEKVRLTHALDIQPVDVPKGVQCTADFSDLLQPRAIDVAVETIGGVGVAYQFTRQLLERGIGVVTSNKELVAEHGDELIALARAHKTGYLYEASVGGGVPIIRPIRTCLAGNRIKRLQGIVNGSTNYLLTRMEDAGLDFSAALAEAKRLGYAEENPAADIEGWDARRKLAILANAAFNAKLSDHALIPTEGIARVTERDQACAKRMGGAVKLIARAELNDGTWSGWVHPALVPDGHPLYHVRDVFNGILVSGDFVGDVLFQGRGAGSLPTASAIVGDIIEMARGSKRAPMNGAAPVAFEPCEPVPARLMVRIESEYPDEAQAAASALLPGCEWIANEGMFIVVTPERPIAQLNQAINQMKAGSARVGIPLRMI